MTMLKKHTRCRDIIYRQGKNVRVSSQENILTEVDGDPGPELPVDISIIPRAIRVMVPENARPAGIRTRIIRAIG
jgi:diacylglycerol kinase family enzyme